MKKKFVLTLALVLMVAVTLSAATPVEVSGTFKAGYDFTFGSASAVTKTGGQASYATLLNFTGDFWKVSLANKQALEFTNEDGNKVNAKAEIYLDKALAAEGVDMGDVTATLFVGTGVGRNAPNVFADTYDDGWKKNVTMSGLNNFGITIGYASLGSAYLAYDPVDGKSFVIGVKAAPMDGVEAALGFTNDQSGDNAIGGSVAVDIAKLVDLDFALKATAEYHGLLASTAVHHIAADIAGSYEGIGLWVEYKTDDVKKHALAAKASYSTTLEGVSLSAGVLFEVLDLANLDSTYDVVADASAGYSMGGVSYNLKAKYAVAAETFTLSPSVTIKF